MKKAIFSGCSFTAGNGWADTDLESSARTEVKDHPNLWVNLCYQNIDYLNQFELINCGQGGASNTEIFETTVREISRFGNNIDIIFCQWTAMPRYNFNVGFELWATSESLQANNHSHDVNLNKGDSYPRAYINDLLGRLRVLHHLHWEILKVVDYTNIITKIANSIGIKKVYFINGLCPWDKNYFLELHNVKPSAYTNFTKTELLNMDTRDDSDIYELYKLAHNHYKSAGGINQSSWVNLYNSFRNQQIDVNFDQGHPGIKSNQIYYNKIKQHIDQVVTASTS